MALQRINWTQIETENVTSGTTIDLGSSTTPLNAVYANNFYLSGTTLSDLISGGGNGSSGSSGTSGTSGVSGTSGSSGSSGARGSSGTSGSNGSSGSSGLSGTSGSSGQDGANGQNGTNGSSGTSGQAGSSGSSGSSGQNGTSGSNGSSGTSGTSGIAGNHGTSGTSGTSGARGTSGTSGTSGNVYQTSSTTYITDIDEWDGLDLTFTVDSNLSYTTGQIVIAASNILNYLIGRVVSYSGTQLIIRILEHVGGSDHSSWSINLYSSISGGVGTGSSTLRVTDGTTTVNGVDQITFDGATVTNNGNGDVTITIVGGGGGGTDGTSGSNGSSGSSGTSGIAGTNGSSGSNGSSGTSGTSGSNGSSGTSGVNGTSGSSGTSPLGFSSGTSGISGSSGSNGSSGTSGSSGLTGTSGTSGQNGTSGTSGVNGTSGTSGVAGTSGTSGTSPIGAAGAPKMYQINLSYTSNVMDDFPGSHTALGPNGENLATLQSAGWVFTKVAGTTLSITRPSGLQVQPLVNIMSHGKNGTSYWSKAFSALAGTGYAAEQTVSGANFTTLTLTGLNNTNTGIVTSGTTTLTITFGLIS